MSKRKRRHLSASYVDAPRQRDTREQSQKIKEEKCLEEFGLATAKGHQKNGQARWDKKNTSLGA